MLTAIRRLLVAIIILLCSGFGPTISTPTAGTAYSQSNLIEGTAARRAPHAQALSLVASVISGARRATTWNSGSEPEMVPMEWNPSRHRTEENSETAMWPPAQSVRRSYFQTTLAG